MATKVLILPGIGSSGPDHWQSLWQQADPAFQRVQQRDWERPVCAEWVQLLQEAVSKAGPDTLLLAHSLGCLLVAHWAAQSKLAIKGAMLVAPPDPEGPNFPPQASGFSPLPLRPFAFPSLVVASSDDPYGDLAFAASAARAWGSRLVNIGAAGHINVASGLGEWRQGQALLRQLGI